jgi:exodeoxyribonuclease-3
VRIATWNVNSLKARQPRVEEWLEYAQPDVLCMQETKLADGAFPAMAFAALGYESYHHGDGQWNGVAILSRVGLEEPLGGFCDGVATEGEERRIVSATCGGVRVHSVYVPNGRSVGSEHYAAKLAWLERLRRHVEATTTPDDLVAVCGDFNVAPEDRDVWDPAAVHGATHVSPPERAALDDLGKLGLTDAFRLVYPDAEKVFSWWDYRAGDFHQGRGMRIDLVLVSRPLAGRVTHALIDRNARKGKLPSDHAPMLVDFDLEASPAP